MIFILRLLIFSILILLGFNLSTHSLTSRKLVTVIYTLTLLYYTLLCRIPTILSTPVYGSDTTAVPTTPSTAEKIWTVLKLIFGSQPDGTLAGGGVFVSIVMNGLLFVPCGYLLMIWFPQLRRRRGAAVVIALAVSICIELLQEITGLGMGDWKDIIGNTLGAAIGIVMVERGDYKAIG